MTPKNKIDNRLKLFFDEFNSRRMSVIKSRENDHKFRESRIMDFYYDPIYHVPDSRSYRRLVDASIPKIAEMGIITNFEYMFTEGKRYPRKGIFFKLENFDFQRYNRSVTSSKKIPCAIYCTLPKEMKKSKVELIEVNEKHNTKVQNKATQSDYRESETQTKPWYPPITNDAIFPVTVTSLNFGWNLIRTVRKTDKISKSKIEMIEIPENDKDISLKDKVNALKKEDEEYRKNIDEMKESNDRTRKIVTKRMMTHCLEVNREKIEQQINRYTELQKQKMSKHIYSINLKKERELRKIEHKTRMESSQSFINTKCHKTRIGMEKIKGNDSVVYEGIIKKASDNIRLILASSDTTLHENNKLLFEYLG